MKVSGKSTSQKLNEFEATGGGINLSDYLGKVHIDKCYKEFNRAYWFYRSRLLRILEKQQLWTTEDEMVKCALSDLCWSDDDSADELCQMEYDLVAIVVCNLDDLLMKSWLSEYKRHITGQLISAGEQIIAITYKLGANNEK